MIERNVFPPPAAIKQIQRPPDPLFEKCTHVPGNVSQFVSFPDKDNTINLHHLRSISIILFLGAAALPLGPM